MNAAGTWRRYLDVVGPGVLPTLGRCLSGPVLRELGATGRSAYLAAAITETGFAKVIDSDLSVKDTLAAIFELLRRSYRCDYVYRSAIATKLFLGRHSPATTALFPEFRVWKSKADMAMFNGTSIAYEIKTELDNLDRLHTQLRDYSSIFDRIFVVTYEAQSDDVLAMLPPHVGLLVLSRALSFRVVRDALSNADNALPRKIVDALRRDEVVELTRRVIGRVPEATNVNIVDECANALAACAPRRVHDAMVDVLKQRMRCTRDDLAPVSRPLLSAYLESGVRPKMWSVITDVLTNVKIGNLIQKHGEVLPVSESEAV